MIAHLYIGRSFFQDIAVAPGSDIAMMDVVEPVRLQRRDENARVPKVAPYYRLYFRRGYELNRFLEDNFYLDCEMTWGKK